MALQDIVNVTISATTSTPTRQGFGTPLIGAYHTKYVDRVRVYNLPNDLLSDGFTTSDDAFLAATALKAQNPSIKKFKLGRLALPVTDTLTMQILDSTTGDVIAFTLEGVAFSYTIPGASTPTTVALAIKNAINAAAIATLGTATVSTDTITIPGASAGKCLRLKGWDVSKVQIENTSADAGIATDLAAIAAADNDWYGLGLTQQGKNTVLAAAAYANTNKKLFGYDTPSSSVLTSSTTDVASTLKNSAYEHTFGMYNGQDTKAYPALALMGSRLSQTPGSDTWAFKVLKGILPDTLTPTQYTNAMAKNINIYTTVGGVNITQFGKSADGEYTDTIRFIDWQTAQIQVNVFAALAAMPKIPYTDAGVGVIVGQILGALNDGVKNGGLVRGTPQVQAPAVADVDTINKNNRNLPSVTFSATLAGAIHTMNLVGTVQV